MADAFNISICVSMLNEEDNIERCVDAILASSAGFNCELILLDNGSSDQTSKILGNYNGIDNCKIISFKETVGLHLSRNYLLKNSRGTFAVFLDADGEVGSDYFSVLTQNLSPEYAIYSGPVPEQSTKRNNFYELHYRSLIESDSKFLIGANFVVNIKEALKVGGFPNITVRRGDETPLITLMLNNGSRQYFIDDLTASNHFINSSKDLIKSFYYEGQNAYLYMLYFKEPFVLKTIYKSVFLLGLIVLGISALTQNFIIAFIAISLLAMKLFFQRRYWTKVLHRVKEILSFDVLRSLVVLSVAHVTHEFGFLFSMLTRKKPNCWLDKRKQ